MRRSAALGIVIVLAATACGGGSPDEDATITEATDSYGRPLPRGRDWSGAGAPVAPGGARGADGAPPGAGGSGDARASEVPYGCAGTEGEEAPPDLATPLAAQSSNDFPLKATVTPIRAGAGVDVTVDVLAPAAPEALVVMVASFYDDQDHGMRAAKFADAAGHARFNGPIPDDAPLGWSAIAISVTTKDERSAIDIVNVTVTGPGCE